MENYFIGNKISDEIKNEKYVIEIIKDTIDRQMQIDMSKKLPLLDMYDTHIYLFIF